MNRRLTFIDLFAGIGGFRRGMELAGHKCMGFCEWDKFATASYTSMHLITDEQRQKFSLWCIVKTASTEKNIITKMTANPHISNTVVNSQNTQ